MPIERVSEGQRFMLASMPERKGVVDMHMSGCTIVTYDAYTEGPEGEEKVVAYNLRAGLPISRETLVVPIVEET